MKTTYIALLWLALLSGSAQAGNQWTLHQYPSGNTEVNGVTYIPSESQWEKRKVLSLRKGEVLKLNDKCITSSTGLWKNTKVCTWEMEIHDRGSHVEVLSGGKTKETGLSSRVFALISLVLMPTFLLVRGSRLRKATGLRRNMLVMGALLPCIVSIFSIMPSFSNVVPWTSSFIYFASGIALLASMATPIFYSKERLQEISALVFFGCMLIVAIFT